MVCTIQGSKQMWNMKYHFNEENFHMKVIFVSFQTLCFSSSMYLLYNWLNFGRYFHLGPILKQLCEVTILNFLIFSAWMEPKKKNPFYYPVKACSLSNSGYDNTFMKLDKNNCGWNSYRSEIAFDQKVVFAFLSKGTCHRPLTMQASVVLCK